jgi:protein gp37
MITWNPWHGCKKISEGCRHCYVYSIDGRHCKDASEVAKNSSFSLPLKYDRRKNPKIPPGSTVFTCFTSDFLLPQADAWRPKIWRIMRIREDLDFFIITKRIDRCKQCLPPDWGKRYSNVTIACTAENQKMADYRLPIYKNLPLENREIVCAPLLGRIDLSAHLGPWVKCVSVGGESGKNARVCDYGWVLDIRRQCMENHVAFNFHQTGSSLIKDGKIYAVKKALQRAQARKAGIDYFPYL